ncbi:MAG: hypothetical protein BWK79_12610 [Beggiatoa sp. IS2]|nr:MAG: hypothetical protein BWK79_12610 [Beggiatoa sp. IS2]
MKHFEQKTCLAIVTILSLSSLNAYANLNDGLIVYFPFDQQPENGIVHDESNNGNDGTVNGTPTYEPNGVFGGAYHFTAWGSGSGSWYRDYIVLNGNNPTAGLEALTVSLWIKTNTPRNNYKIASASAWPPGSGWVVGTHYPEIWEAGGGPVFSMTECSVYNETAPNAGEWVHIVITYDAVAFREYSNGRIIKNCPSLAKKIGDAPGQKLAVAAWPQHGFGYDGLMDEFRVYNRALSAKEVLKLELLTTTAYGTLLGRTGKRLGGATIHLGDKTTVTNKNGNWSISDLTPGEYVIIAMKKKESCVSSDVEILDNGKHRQQVDYACDLITYGDDNASVIIIQQYVDGNLQYVDTMSADVFDTKFQEGRDYRIVDSNGEYLLEGLDDTGATTSKIEVVRIQQ